MPEEFCLESTALEIESRAWIKGGTSGLLARDPFEHGLIHFHTNMLSDPNGSRQSVTLHRCNTTNNLFLPLPKARKAAGDGSKCSVCVTPMDAKDLEYKADGLTQFMKGDKWFDNLDKYLSDHPVSTVNAPHAPGGILDTPLSDGFPDAPSSDATLFHSDGELGSDDSGTETLLGEIQDSSDSLDLVALQGKAAAEIVNMLQICGQLFIGQRSKEFVLGIDRYVIRICLGLEAHAFWLPTNDYHTIMAGKPVPRGKKGVAFPIPLELVDGPAKDAMITIQMAFIRPDWTLVFVDH
ncbi:hypothetical protein FIBSPDRAFT_958569 [Athelia psychrophila]|uniref:Uncharacterized protein n=1 Tax=Athelia psychrophila TaxID=1759441 RepID=A0A166EG29_9AGAM|nr:hypothetical protein FIBSPDRAFT_958569 [Fibularhizoctonia sp. CBS 109695]